MVKQLYEFVKASEELPEEDKKYNCLVKGKIPIILDYEKGWGFYIVATFYNPDDVEWLKPIITEQGNDKQILLTKIQEQEIEIASLKSKVNKEMVIVTAKCPRCGNKKEYEMPINFTPWCQVCFGAPMIVKKIKTVVYES